MKVQIMSAIKKAQDNLIHDRELMDEAIKVFKKREKEEEEPIKKLIGEYLDNELKDVDGVSVMEGYVVAGKYNYPAYKVIKRGMQFIFGTPMFNPSVDVVTYEPSKEPKLGKRVKKISKAELSEMRVLFDDVASQV